MSITNFQKSVYNVVSGIKPGRVMTYAEVAAAVGKPKAYRAVGNALNKNSDLNVPCHRVVRSSGGAGGYNKGYDLKEKLLREEGAI